MRGGGGVAMGEGGGEKSDGEEREENGARVLHLAWAKVGMYGRGCGGGG